MNSPNPKLVGSYPYGRPGEPSWRSVVPAILYVVGLIALGIFSCFIGGAIAVEVLTGAVVR